MSSTSSEKTNEDDDKSTTAENSTDETEEERDETEEERKERLSACFSPDVESQPYNVSDTDISKKAKTQSEIIETARDIKRLLESYKDKFEARSNEFDNELVIQPLANRITENTTEIETLTSSTDLLEQTIAMLATTTRDGKK